MAETVETGEIAIGFIGVAAGINIIWIRKIDWIE